MPLRPFFTTAPRFAAAKVDESSQPVIMSGYSQDEVIFAIQTRCTSVDKLLAYYEENQNRFTIVHRSVLLAKLRTVLAEDQTLTVEKNLAASSLFHNVSRYLMNNLHEMDCTSLASTINIFAKGRTGIDIEPFQPDQMKLVQIEKQILAQYELYINQDISVIVSSLMKMDYTPKKLLEAMNKMSQMSTFNQDQCVRMLDALSEDRSNRDQDNPVIDELFDKFFRQLEKHSLALNSYNICRALHCVREQTKLKRIQDAQPALYSMQLRAKFLVDRLSDMLSREQDVAVLDLYWGNVFASEIDKVLNAHLGKQKNYTPLDLRKLQLFSVQELQEQLEKIDPKIIVNTMELFQNERHRKILVQKTLEGLRAEKIDIRKFQLNQLARFIKFVATFQPQDVKVFFNYVMTAFENGFFTITKHNFGPMSEILYLFVKNGFLSPEEQNKFFLSFLLTLKQNMLPETGKEERVDMKDLVKITWSLVVMQKPGTLSIPLIPKLLEQISQFDRPEQPLTDEELLMLHQINIYVQDLVAREKLPDAFLKIIPQEAASHAREVYNAWDKPLYPEVQKEIAIKLLRLRVQFKENTLPVSDQSNMNKAILNQFTVPFRLGSSSSGEDGMVILLRGEQNSNLEMDRWYGMHGFKARMLMKPVSEVTSERSLARGKAKKSKLEVKEINVQKWQKLDENEKMELLSSMLPKTSKNAKMARKLMV